jgi:hypothetical protein
MGYLFGAIEEVEDLYGLMETRQRDIINQLETSQVDNLLGSVITAFDTLRGAMSTFIGAIGTIMENRTIHDGSILDELPEINGSRTLADVWPVLYGDMGGTVKENSVTIGSVTKIASEKTTPGTFIVDKGLSGITNPDGGFSIHGKNWNAIPDYTGVDSELTYSNIAATTISIKCIADSTPSGTSEGAESFQVNGLAQQSNGLSFRSETDGPGTGPVLTPIQGSSFITNMFENFTANLPDGWAIETGAAGTDIFEETTTVFSTDSGSALRLTDSDAKISFDLSGNSNINQLDRLLVAIYVQGAAGIAAGTLTIQLEGTGYTPGASEKIEMNAAALAAQTSYGLEYFFVDLPRDIPSDLKLTVGIASLTGGESVYLDDGGIIVPTYFDGVSITPTIGSDKFYREDHWEVDLTNGEAGRLQRAVTRMLGYQAPSSVGGTYTDTTGQPVS